MAKTKKLITSKPKQDTFFSTFDINRILPEKYHVLSIILIMVILFIVFLNPLFFGNKTFQSGDIIASESMIPYIEKERDGFSLWNPHIFCGMPAHGLGTTFPWFNVIALVFTEVRELFTSIFAVNYVRWTVYLFILGINMFLFVRYLTRNYMLSLFAAVATSFSTGLIVFLFIGHVTKLTSLAFYPLIFLFVFKLQEEFKLINFLWLIIVLQLFIQGFHVQIIFYTLFALGFYYLYFLIRYFAKKESEKLKGLIKSGVLLVVATVFSILISADNLTQIYEYTPYSTRGTTGVIEASQPKTSKSDSDYYEYHTNWSFSIGEVLTFIIPSYYGFGNVAYKGPLTNGQEVEVNTYFGQMPFVDVAMYMGILVFFLAIYGAVSRRREPLVQYFTILTIVALFISFGKNFPILFDMMFYYFPYFDKFRVPSMILVLVQITVPVLAAYGLKSLLEVSHGKDAKALNSLKYFIYGTLGLFILLLLLSGILNTWFMGRVLAYANSLQATQQQLSQQFQALASFMADMFVGDVLIGFGLVAFFALGILLYINRKLSSDVVILLAIFIVVIDLWRIDARGAQYKEYVDIKSLFQKPDYATFFEKSGDNLPYRIFNIKQDGSIGSFRQNSNYNAYFLLEDFYGYSGIKPRAYQDYMDVVGPVNPTMWNMLNVKYIITEGGSILPDMTPIYNTQKTTILRNDRALERVFLVNKVEKKTPIEILNLVKQNAFNPSEVAFVSEDIEECDELDSTAVVKIKDYKDERIMCEVTANGNNFLFLGNTYVSAGWKAYINNEQTKVYRVNHGFMGVIVPKGTHNVEFVYSPNSFYISKYVVLVLSSLTVLGLVATMIIGFRKEKNSKNN